MNNVQIPDGSNQLAIFQGRKIRSIKHHGEWWYSVIDIIEVLTDSKNPRRYWSDLKTKLLFEGSQLYENIVQLKLRSADNKDYLTDVLNVEDVLRLIQSISSPKAEPFKRWLAKIGQERLQELQDPSSIVKRAMLQYKKRGYDEEWIETRVNNILDRMDLENEWSQRGINSEAEFALLTDAISLEAFGIDTKKHKLIKKIGKPHILRDNMTRLELLFTSLAEQSTTNIARTRNAQGFNENKQAAKEGGKIAGDARRSLENVLGEPVVSDQNYLGQKNESNHLPAPKKRFTQLIRSSSRSQKKNS